MKQIDLSRKSRRGTVRVLALIEIIVAAFIFAPILLDGQSNDLESSLPGLDRLRIGEATLLKSGLARSLIYDFRGVAPVPADVDLKAFQMEKERGIELVSLYRKTAPAVVFILVEGGHGSGFMINKDGWLITNHHVAQHGTLREDLSREVTVMFGKFNEQGSMEPIRTKYRAEVYSWDNIRDLALLKLKEMPLTGSEAEVRAIKIADKAPIPGDDVVAIGHAGVTLLWSLKPGVVQGVGRKLSDLAMDFARKELQSEHALKTAVGSQTPEVEREIERELQPMRNVLVVQATCPILEGDSGGPLLNVTDGQAVGMTAYYNTKSFGGAAHFFIHAGEIRDFLKDVPAGPMKILPAFWTVAASRCSIVDLDTNGQPDTIILSQVAPTAVGPRTNVVAVAWDLDEHSDFKPFVRKTPAGNLVDVEAVVRTKAMRLQVYTVKDNNTQVWAYDLNNDGHFELVRLAREGSNSCDSELYSEGLGKPYQLRKLAGRQGAMLDVSQLPDKWRARYEKVVLGLFKAKKIE